MPGTHPGKYLEHDFPGHEVAQLLRKEVAARRPAHSLERWWGRRLGSLWRSVLLAGLISWDDWENLEPWSQGAQGDAADSQGRGSSSAYSVPQAHPDQQRDEWSAHARVRFDQPPSAWQRLFYRLDEEAERVIGRSGRNKLIVQLWTTGSALVQESLRLGVDVLGAVPDPAAWFIIKQTSEGMAVANLRRAAQAAQASAADDLRALYRTSCPACGRAIEWSYIVWVRLARCLTPGCAAEVPLFTSFVLKKAGRGKAVPGPSAQPAGIIVCPACGQVYADAEETGVGSSCGSYAQPDSLHTGYVTVNDFTCPQCGARHAVCDGTRAYGRPGYRMVALWASCPSCAWQGYKQADAEDKALFERAQQRWQAEQDTLRLPEQGPPFERPAWSRLAACGITRWTDLFNERQLLLVSRLREAVLKISDDEAREYLLLAWSALLEHHTVLTSYQPGSGRLGGAFGTRGMVLPCMWAERNPWVEAKAGHTFSTQLARLEDYLQWAHRPDEPLLRNGRAIRVTLGDGLWPRRSVRTLLCRSSEEPQTLFEGRRADLIVVDLTDSKHQTLAAQLSEFFCVWLRGGLASDYPVIFGRSASSQAARLPTPEVLTHTLSGAADCLADDGLLVLACQQPITDSWTATLQPVVSAGLAIKAIHPVCLKELPGSVIPDWAAQSCLALIVCGRPAHQPEPIDWQQLREVVAQVAEQCVTQLNSQAEERHLSAPDIYVLALGRCLAEYTRHFHRGKPVVYWQDQPVSLAQALDGDAAQGMPGIAAYIEQLLEQAEAQRWPAGLDPVSQLYFTTLLGQSYLPRARLEARLARYPGISLELLRARRLVRGAGERVRVLPEAKRQAFLTTQLRLATERGLLLQGKLSQVPLLMVDRLHLLALSAQRGELPAMLAQSWAGDPLLAELARLVAMRLPPGHSSRTLYQQVAETLTDGTAL